MTVETSSSSSPSVSGVTRKNRTDVIKQIQEITAFDELTINRAIEACQDSDGRYSMDQVLNVLMDDKYSNDYTESKNSYSANYTPSTNGHRNNSTNADDLNNLKQKAKISYTPMTKSNFDSEYSNIGDEDDMNNETDLVRENEKPCGLRNVGNTCWFNSIIQAFFHLPYFRKLVLSYQISPIALEKLDDNSKNVVQFVFELRKLFALLLKSKRKAINPNNSLRVLRNCSKFDVNHFSQEDVSEFSTILVNLIEESFEIVSRLEHQTQQIQQSPIENDIQSAIECNVTSTINLKTSDETCKDFLTRKNRKNPIVNLLNGDVMICRKNVDEDVIHNRIEIFREVNIQMLNARNLYDSLELEWGETSIDAISNNSKAMAESLYEQESWIVQLPSVLFICLNRYKFVKATQSSSKILEPFEFYPFIYLDRYMYANKEAIKLKRKELKLLNNELKGLEEKLKTIKNYNYENKSYALDEVLNCALNFATKTHDNCLFSELKPLPTSEHLNEHLDKSLVGLKMCLENWIIEIKHKINELEANIKDMKEKINRIYDEDTLKNVKYNLHSVCVHEGSATLGHFWTYIWNTKNEKWYKYNDMEVIETTWDELYADAIGGVKKENERTPSGYFLVYVKENDECLYNDVVELTPDLEKLIQEDDETLKNQLSTIKYKQILKLVQDKLKKIIPLNTLSTDNHQTCIEHAKAFVDFTLVAFQSSFDKILTCGAEEALAHSIEHELNRFNESCKEIQQKLPDNDFRTNHILTYLNCNQATRELRELAIVDVFRMQVFADNDLRIKILQTQAQLKYQEILNDSTNMDLLKAYEKLQNDYKDYRSIVAAFITACSHLEVERYEEATPFYCVSVEFNERITNNAKIKMKGMDHDLLLKCRRRCFKLWNQAIIRKLTNAKTSECAPIVSNTTANNNNIDIDVLKNEDNDQTVLIEIMIGKFLPCFYRLATSTNEDKAFIEEIRQDWLSILDSSLAELSVYQDFMTKLFEEPYGNHFHQLSVNKSNLFDRYRETVQSLRLSVLKQ